MWAFFIFALWNQCCVFEFENTPRGLYVPQRPWYFRSKWWISNVRALKSAIVRVFIRKNKIHTMFARKDRLSYSVWILFLHIKTRTWFQRCTHKKFYHLLRKKYHCSLWGAQSPGRVFKFKDTMNQGFQSANMQNSTFLPRISSPPLSLCPERW